MTGDLKKHRLGVDISEHNGDVNFEELKAAGVSFVIIRCGYGSDYPKQDDNRFFENIRKAEISKMDYGVYLYSHATTPNMATSEVAHVMRLLGDHKPKLGVWYDVEEFPQWDIGTKAITDVIIRFMQGIEANGLKVGVYSSSYWWGALLSDKRLNDYPKWVAEWGPTLNRTDAEIWQYTDALEISGKYYDGNLLLKEVDKVNYDEFKKFMSQWMSEQAKKPASDWAKEDIDFLKKQGIVVGDASGNVTPQSLATRQEIFAMLARIFRKLTNT